MRVSDIQACFADVNVNDGVYCEKSGLTNPASQELTPVFTAQRHEHLSVYGCLSLTA